MTRKRKPRLRQEPRIERVQLDATTPIAPLATVCSIVVPLALAVLTIAAYYPALGAEFVNLDDDRLFLENNSYRGFDADRVRWMFTTTFMGHYHPVTWLSSALDYKISGTDPSSYHRNNILLHSLNGILVYFVSMRLLAAALRTRLSGSPLRLRLASGVAAMLFAVHPLRVESVAWATERRDVLSTFFFLLALLTYLKASPPGESRLRSRAWYAASLTLLVMSLLSKAWGMSFVLIVLVLDIYPLRRLTGGFSTWWSRDRVWFWMQKLPFLLAGLAAAAMAGYAQRSAMDTMKTLEEWGVLERIIQSCYGLTFYLGKTVWPTQLAVIRELPYEMNPFSASFAFPVLSVCAATAFLLARHRRVSGVSTAAIVYVIISVPVLGIVQSGPQLVADRYSYLSCISWAILAAGGLIMFWQRCGRKRRILVSLGTAVALVLLFAGTRRQTEVWRNSRSLWQHAMRVSPSSIAFQNYGILLRAEGHVEEAIRHYRRAIEIRPDAGNAWFALGNALKQQEKYEEAERAYIEAVKYMTQKHSGYLNLGNLYYNNLRRLDDAISAYQSGIEYMEAHRSKLFAPTLYLALGIALRQKGDNQAAVRPLEIAFRYRSTKDRAASHLQDLRAMETRKPP